MADSDVLKNSSLGRVIAGGLVNPLNALTLGFGDEGISAINAAIDSLLGRSSWSDAYTQRLGQARDVREEFRAAAGPGLATTQDFLAGALLPIKFKSAPARTSSILDEFGKNIVVPAVRPSLAKLGGTGAALGAGYGFGESEGGLQERLVGSAIGSLVGGAAGTALPAVGRRLAELQAGPTSELGSVILRSRKPGTPVPGLPVEEALRQFNKTNPIPILEGVDVFRGKQLNSLDDAIEAAYEMKYISPVFEKGTQGARGNLKIVNPNSAYEQGRLTCDREGCGRLAFLNKNEIPGGACGTWGKRAGICFAERGAQRKGKTVIEQSMKALEQDDPLVKLALESIKERGLAETRMRPEFDKFIVKYFKEGTKFAKGKVAPKGGKATVRPRPLTQGAMVYDKYRFPEGSDLRLGVTTDGSVYLAHPPALESLYKGNPNSISFISSAYYKPGETFVGNPLQDRSVVNQSVWADQSLAEAIHRLMYAENARTAGWNTVLRTVTADPKLASVREKGEVVFEPEHIAAMNRLNNFYKSDLNTFATLEQPAHFDKNYGDPQLDLKKIAACCQTSGHNCLNCMAGCGIGRDMLAQMGDQALDLFGARPNWKTRVEANAAQAALNPYQAPVKAPAE